MMASATLARTHPVARAQSTFFISMPQQQRGMLSPPPPGCAPFVTWISQPQAELGQRYNSPVRNAIGAPD
jgi:hypothetical protein